MKKIFFLALILALITAAANAQQIQTNRAQLTKSERRHLRMDQRRLRNARRIAKSDGLITPAEKRRLAMLRKDERRDLKRYRRSRIAA